MIDALRSFLKTMTEITFFVYKGRASFFLRKSTGWEFSLFAEERSL